MFVSAGLSDFRCWFGADGFGLRRGHDILAAPRSLRVGVKIVCCSCWSRRTVFPTLQKNESPISILPQFLQVLGRKIEVATEWQDSGVEACSLAAIYAYTT